MNQLLELNSVYQMDALEGLRMLADDSVDIVITDPPYGVRKKEEWDRLLYFLENLEKWLTECYRVSKYGVIWFCADKMLPYIFDITEKNKIEFHRMLIWNKPPGSQYAGAMHNKLWYSLEPILVFSKTSELLKIKDAPSYGYATFDARTVPKKKYGHPTTKPLELMEWLVLHYTREGFTVCDPFSGSGSTLVACAKHNRNFIGFELQQEYVEIAKSRLENVS